MTAIDLYGFPVSPHVRAARIAFAEKSLPVVHHAIGFDDLGTDAYARINPFRKMPALVHDLVTLYETPALLVYADSTGQGAGLQPAAAVDAARMWQFIGVAQHYLFPVGVMQLYFHNVLAGLFGMEPDLDLAAAAVAPTARHLDVLETALAGGHLAGGVLTLADIYCGAMVDYIGRTRDGGALVAARPQLSAWLAALRARESFSASLAPMLVGTDQT